MNKRRAIEIASSAQMANVTFNGRPIYIESVNDTKDMASIHPLDQPYLSQEVSLTMLVEQE